LPIVGFCKRKSYFVEGSSVIEDVTGILGREGAGKADKAKEKTGESDHDRWVIKVWQLIKRGRRCKENILYGQ
jgi:hypothetical protein